MLIGWLNILAGVPKCASRSDFWGRLKAHCKGKESYWNVLSQFSNDFDDIGSFETPSWKKNNGFETPIKSTKTGFVKPPISPPKQGLLNPQSQLETGLPLQEIRSEKIRESGEERRESERGEDWSGADHSGAVLQNLFEEVRKQKGLGQKAEPPKPVVSEEERQRLWDASVQCVSICTGLSPEVVEAGWESDQKVKHDLQIMSDLVARYGEAESLRVCNAAANDEYFRKTIKGVSDLQKYWKMVAQHKQLPVEESKEAVDANTTC